MKSVALWALALILVIALPSAILYASDTRPEAKPAVTGEKFKEDPAAGVEAGKKQAAATEATAPTDWKTGVLTGLGIAISIAAFLTGVSKLAAPASIIGRVLTAGRNMMWSASTPAQELKAEQNQAALADGMRTTVRVIQQIPGLGKLKDALSKNLPSEANDIIKQLIRRLEDSGIDADNPTVVLAPPLPKPVDHSIS